MFIEKFVDNERKLIFKNQSYGTHTKNLYD